MAKRAGKAKVNLVAELGRVLIDFRIGSQRDHTVPWQQFANGNARRNENGTVAAIRRDGLIDLFTSGAINADQQAAGLHYRDAFEAVHASGRSADIPSLASGASCARVDITDRACDAQTRLKLLDRIIEPQCQNIVRAVAGEGKSVRKALRGGKSRDLGIGRLRVGLGRLVRFLGSHT